ncbi:WecB/TagA/CpsF family glycosyltransferase [Tenuibacillus multivorans]|uniref:N-acetylglucosaminyldiphosphoundecaprenol N-acetyl-beta-D-mannosaminyltransferase n=1 Tax=Tenuibacillus multivorans TaxID=237069 RepID=A0A1G9X6J0_9BACI|nr:WecB/TagA/CpsF family glycosyltransferase [Tenuibacillus multivorans]GEL78657.1 acetylglucosaminyldiphosphoundecaprenol acetyl-beta-D-mannosaminyltransferase [Tenuibacillus multivorans]SDM92384.1 N-acetylglucosaminyldiphosphoundecaprenol N-acetyl-beta-D-mannosaminyltransferase [Tenuibacillus multivorans]
MRRVTILGVPFIHIDQDGFVSLLEERISEKKKTFVVTANPEIVMLAQENDEFMRLAHEADFVTADGVGVVKGAQLLGEPLPGRVTGFDTIHELFNRGDEKGYRFYFLGAKPEIIETAQEKIVSQYPGLEIVGYRDGYFDWDDPSVAQNIRDANPDIVLVGLGAPRQEKWISEHLDEFDHGVFIGVGGSFDGIAGTMKRAPKIWQKLNLEWLYRLFQQPSRWRRMLALPRFGLKILKQKVKGSR